MGVDMEQGQDELGHYWILPEDKIYTCGMCDQEITQGEKAYEFYQQDDPRPTKLTLCEKCMRNIQVAKEL